MSRKSRAMWLALYLPAIQGFAAPTPEEVENAKQVQVLAEARKATAQAEEAEARAKLGTLDLSKLPHPTAEVKTLDVEATLLAYGAVQAVARDIAKTVSKQVKQRTVFIYTEREFTLLEQYRSFTSNMTALSTEIMNVRVPTLRSKNPTCAATRGGDKEAGGGVSSLGPLGSLDVVAQVLSLFKANKELAGANVSVDSFALSAAVAAELQAEGAKAIYPPLLLSSIALQPRVPRSAAETELDNLTKGLTRAEAVLAEVSGKRAVVEQQKRANKKPSTECTDAYATDEQSLLLLAARVQTLKDRAAKYIAAAVTPDDKTGATLMQSLISADIIREKALGGLVLQLKPIAAGGTTLTKTTFFSSSFRFSGGAVVGFMLVEGDGELVKSGVVSKYGGLANPNQLSATLDELSGKSTSKR